MRPHIICHMASTIDGKIDGEGLQNILPEGEYEKTGAKLRGDAWICGRTTMQLHFAQDKPFISRSKKSAGSQPVYVARKAKSYAISVDTNGTLRWAKNNISGDHLICIVSERASTDYLAMLRRKKISYIVAGRSSVDLVRAMDSLGEHFGIHTLLLEGGGHINGGFLKEGLIDEVSLLLAPGIDGRHKIPAVFDGIVSLKGSAVPLKLKFIEKRKGGVLWIRYEVVQL